MTKKIPENVDRGLECIVAKAAGGVGTRARLETEDEHEYEHCRLPLAWGAYAILEEPYLAEEP